jgi:hypothetical protein
VSYNFRLNSMSKRLFLVFFAIISNVLTAQNLNDLERSVSYQKFTKEEWQNLTVNIVEEFRRMNSLHSREECKILIIQQVPESQYQGSIPNVPLGCIGKFDSDHFKFRILQLSEVGTAVCKLQIDGKTVQNQLYSSFYIQTENPRLRSYLNSRIEVLGIDTLESQSKSPYYKTNGSGSEEEFCANLSLVVGQIDRFFDNLQNSQYNEVEQKKSLVAELSFLNAANAEISGVRSKALFSANNATSVSFGYSGSLTKSKGRRLALFNTLGAYFRNQTMNLSYEANNQLVGNYDKSENFPIYSSYNYSADIKQSYVGLFNEISLKYEPSSKANFYLKPSLSLIPGLVYFSSTITQLDQGDLFILDETSGLEFRDLDVLAPFEPNRSIIEGIAGYSFLDLFLGMSVGYETKRAGIYLGYKAQNRLFEKSDKTLNALPPDFEIMVSEFRKSSISLKGLFLGVSYNY